MSRIVVDTLAIRVGINLNDLVAYQERSGFQCFSMAIHEADYRKAAMDIGDAILSIDIVIGPDDETVSDCTWSCVRAIRKHDLLGWSLELPFTKEDLTG